MPGILSLVLLVIRVLTTYLEQRKLGEKVDAEVERQFARSLADHVAELRLAAQFGNSLDTLSSDERLRLLDEFGGYRD